MNPDADRTRPHTEKRRDVLDAEEVLELVHAPVRNTPMRVQRPTSADVSP